MTQVQKEDWGPGLGGLSHLRGHGEVHGGKMEDKEWTTYQVGPPGQGHEDQGPGRYLCILPAIKEAVITDVLLGASLEDDILKTVQSWATTIMLVLVLRAPRR